MSLVFDDFDEVGKKRALTPEDVVKMVGCSAPRVSPDGANCVFVRTTTTPADLSKKNCVFIVSLNTAPPNVVRQLTQGPQDSDPCWSPDSQSVAFLRKDQIHVVSINAGEAYPITDFVIPISNLDWSRTFMT